MTTMPDAELLAQVADLHITARHLAQGALAGMHRSSRRGTSIEFNAHRVYAPGDDVRHIDWRAYAKTDKFHIKEFEDETSLRIVLMLDHSGSMGFAGSQSGTLSKLVYARQLTAALAYMALRQGDAVGLTTFAGDTQTTLPCLARSNHLMEILTRISNTSPQGTTQLQAICDHVAGNNRKRALIILLSDLFDPHPQAYDGLLRLRARGHDVAVLHLMDQDEVDFPFDSPAQFVAMEDARQLFVHPRVLRNAYIQEMQQFLERTRHRLTAAHIDYHRVSTTLPPSHVLTSFLHARNHSHRAHQAR